MFLPLGRIAASTSARPICLPYNFVLEKIDGNMERAAPAHVRSA
jgi:hypothetical protein